MMGADYYCKWQFYYPWFSINIIIIYLAPIINHKGNQWYIIYGNGQQFGFWVCSSLGNFTVIVEMYLT